MGLLTAKALHIVGFISWFAGLFYLVRLFVYHAEASQRPEDERRVLLPQLELMQTRLWSIIATPAMVLTIVAGSYMIFELGTIAPWLRLKLGLLAGLVAYHVVCGTIRRAQRARGSTWTSKQLRMWNEIATMFMVAIVFLAVFKSALSMMWGVVGLLVLGAVLTIAMRLYRRALEQPGAADSSPHVSEAAVPASPGPPETRV